MHNTQDVTPQKSRHGITGNRGARGAQYAEWRRTARKWCPTCETEKPLAEYHFDKRGYPIGRCKECMKANDRTPERRAYRTEWNRQNRKNNPLALFKQRVNHLTRFAVKLGLLTPQPCEVCGDWDVHAHHTDYRKPLEVRWLCQKHHATLHQSLRASRRAPAPQEGTRP